MKMRCRFQFELATLIRVQTNDQLQEKMAHLGSKPHHPK
jgi:hypothetical protein